METHLVPSAAWRIAQAKKRKKEEQEWADKAGPVEVRKA